jgi:HEAT repeat protein
LLAEKDEPAGMKLLYIEVLQRIGSPAGAMALIKEALGSTDVQVRSKALDALRELGRLHAVSAFTKGLQDSNNLTVNRAAEGLAAMEDPESVPALIDALVTKHRFQVQPAGGAFNPVFNNGPGGGLGGLNMGGNKPKIIEREIPNESVRDALVKLTGVNHGFDQQAWRGWQVRRDLPQSNQLRRSE